MILKEKIIVTFLYVFGVLILIKMNKFLNARLKADLLKSNPKLVNNASWLFSNKKVLFINCILIGLTITSIVMVWLNKIDSFLLDK